MKRIRRRLLANFYYLRRPLKGFLPLVLATLFLVLIGGFSFYFLYQSETGERLTFSEALYLTWCLIFMEHLYDYPDHWVLQTFYFILPILGLVVILDGFVRFSVHILRRDDTRKEWIKAVAKTYSNHVVLCGLGKLGLRVLQQLLQLKEEVLVLEKDPHCPNIAFARRHGVAVMIGSGREEGLLDDLNLAHAKSIILATNDDLANLEIALDARQFNPTIRIVMRMFDQELASKVRDSFDVTLAFSTSAISAPVFATSSSDRSIVNAFYVGEKLLVVAKMAVRSGSELEGKTVRELRINHDIFIISHERNGQIDHYPPGDVPLQSADQVVLQTEPSTLRQMHEWNHDPKPY